MKVSETHGLWWDWGCKVCSSQSGCPFVPKHRLAICNATTAGNIDDWHCGTAAFSNVSYQYYTLTSCVNKLATSCALSYCKPPVTPMIPSLGVPVAAVVDKIADFFANFAHKEHRRHNLRMVVLVRGFGL